MGLSTAAIIALSTAAGAGATAAANIYGANEQAGATTNAADLQAQAAAATLAFNQQQAEALYHQQQTTNQANYGQYAANTQRLNSVGDILGLPGTTVPPFVSMPDPGFTTAPTPAPTGTNQGGPAPTTAQYNTPGGGTPPAGAPATTTTTGNPTDIGYITSQLQQLYAKSGKTPTGPGTGPTDIAYMAQQIAASGGWQGGNIGYWTDKISGLLSGTGSTGSTGSTTATTGAKPASVAQYLAMSPTPYTTPATPVPYYSPQSVDAYLKNPYGGGVA